MTRRFLPFIVLSLSIFSYTPKVDAQWYGYGAYGYGYGNWCGWNFAPNFWGAGATAQGSILTGMGFYLQGAGEYNYLTAEANAINTQTWMTLNEYLYQSQQVANARYAKRMAERRAKKLALAEKRYTQLRDFPTASDVRNGSAINLKVALLTNPAIAATVYDALKVDMPASLIETIPLTMGQYAVTNTLGEFRKGLTWPEKLQGEDYVTYRQAIDKDIAAIAKDNFATNVTAANDFLVDTNALDTYLVSTKKSVGEAASFVAKLKRTAKAIAKGSYGTALQAVAQLSNPTLGSLLQTMNENSMRFGGAETTEQATANEKLFAVIRSAPTLLDKDTLATLAEIMAKN
jgi:hypothetical protein